MDFQTIPAIDILITGFFSGGGSTFVNYTGISTATIASLGWNNLVQVTFTTNDNAAIDNLNMTTSVPEPATLTIFALGIMGLVIRRLQKQ